MIEKLVKEYRQTVEEMKAAAEWKRTQEVQTERVRWEKAMLLAWQNWGLDTLIGPACFSPRDDGGRHPALIASTTVDGMQLDVTLRHETTTGDRAFMRLHVQIDGYETTNAFAICDSGATLPTAGDVTGWLVEKIAWFISKRVYDQAQHARRLRVVATIRRQAAEYAAEQAAYDQACHSLATAITMEHWQPCPLWLIRYVPISISDSLTDGDSDPRIQELVILEDPEEVATWLRQGRLIGVTAVAIDGYTKQVWIPSLLDAKRIDVQPPGITAWMPYWRSHRYGACYAKVPPTTPDTWRFPAAPKAPGPADWLRQYMQWYDGDSPLSDLAEMTDEEFVAKHGGLIKEGGGDADLQPE